MSNPYPPNPYQPDPYSSGNSNPYPQPSTNYSQFDGSYSQPPPTYSQPPEGYSQPQYNPAPPAYGQPVYQPQPVLMVAQQPTNNKALISMILGICSYVIAGNLLTGIPAIIFGHMALREINASGGLQQGRGMAIAGLVLGYLATIGTALFCAFWIFFVILAVGASNVPR